MKRLPLILLLTALTLCSTGCSRIWQSVKDWQQEGIARRDAEQNADKIIHKGKTLLGKKYKYGATGPNRFDCSGFTMTCYQAAGIKLPRSADGQRDFGRRLKKGEPLQKGDLVFFAPRGGNKNVLGHVGIVVSYSRRDNTFTFIHAAVTNGVEIQSSETKYYKDRYICASRVLPDF